MKRMAEEDRIEALDRTDLSFQIPNRFDVDFLLQSRISHLSRAFSTNRKGPS